MNSPSPILVAYKKSRYQRLVDEEQDPAIVDLIDRDHISVQDLENSHRSHRRSLEEIVDHLDAQGAHYDLCYRGDIDEVEGYGLVIAVGGDGTVLDLSHRVDDTPILSINSDPDSSVGYFSAGTAYDFPRLYEQIVDDDADPVRLRRFHIRIDDKRLGPPILNDVLVSHPNPAAVTTYFLKIGAHPAEAQKSSGIWISTAAGSTAAIRSAGGLVLPLDSDNLQYLVREPFPPREGGYRFLKGIHPSREPLEVISGMRKGAVFVDGPHLSFEFPIGSTLSIDADAPDLSVFGLQKERRTG